MKNKLPRFRDALTFSVLLLVLPAVYPVQEAGRLPPFFPLRCRQGGSSMLSLRLGPQPPCGKEP